MGKWIEIESKYSNFIFMKENIIYMEKTRTRNKWLISVKTNFSAYSMFNFSFATKEEADCIYDEIKKQLLGNSE